MSAWGDSWGVAWGDAWGASVTTPTGGLLVENPDSIRRQVWRRKLGRWRLPLAILALAWLA